MATIHKTKETRGFYYALIPLAVLAVVAILAVSLGLKAAYIFIAFVFWVYALISMITLLRTQNLSFLVVALFQIVAGILMFYSPTMVKGDLEPVMVAVVALTVFLMIWAGTLMIGKRLKWRGREILELAAAPVDEIGNGYTPRPLPAGKTNLTQDQIAAFSGFARRNLLALTYRDKDRIAFVPVAQDREIPFILGLKVNYIGETWVAFDSAGNVSVNISRRDYLMYREAYAFEQVCASLANLFVEFITMHQRGEGVRILDRLDSLNISWFS